MKEKWQRQLQNSKRIVVKVGTSTITHPSGKLNLERIATLIREIVAAAKGREVLLVTSGAIGIGSASTWPDSQTNNHPCQTSS